MQINCLITEWKIMSQAFLDKNKDVLCEYKKQKEEWDKKQQQSKVRAFDWKPKDIKFDWTSDLCLIYV